MFLYMHSIQTLQSYVRLLSVHLFSLMDDGERLLDSQIDDPQSRRRLKLKTKQAHEWISLLGRFDPGLGDDIHPSVLPVARCENLVDVENLVNGAAQYLMGLEERYGIFAKEPDHSPPTLEGMPSIPVGHFDEDGEYTGPRLV